MHLFNGTFLRVNFLESQSRFKILFSLGFLSDVYLFSYRVGCPKGVGSIKKRVKIVLVCSMLGIGSIRIIAVNHSNT